MPEPKDLERTSQPSPTVIYGGNVESTASIDADELVGTMRSLGVSDQNIDSATIYLDPKNRIQTFGAHYPNRVGRLRFLGNSGIRDSKGDIVRISTKIKGKPRTPEEMNKTLVHELEHLAQQDRHDKKLTQGHIAIWGLAAAGAVLGNRLGRGRSSSVLGTVLGGVAGHSAGYLIAPHERQARSRAREVTSRAVTTNSHR